MTVRPGTDAVQSDIAVQELEKAVDCKYVATEAYSALHQVSSSADDLRCCTLPGPPHTAPAWQPSPPLGRTPLTLCICNSQCQAPRAQGPAAAAGGSRAGSSPTFIKQ